MARWLDWRGAVVGFVAFLVGAWAVVYSCNTATAACKGVSPWPALQGTLNRGGSVLVAVGLVAVVASAVVAIVRAVRGPGRPDRPGDRP